MQKLMSETKFYGDYSRWVDSTETYETWSESVERVINMHRLKYQNKMSDELNDLINEAQALYNSQHVLAAQRTLQFGGEQIFKHEAKVYNCSSSYADRPAFFQEAMYLLLCGCGVGFSVQTHHIAKLPHFHKHTKQTKKIYQVRDEIEGWADAFGVLLSSYISKDHAPFPEYSGHDVFFDFSQIRPAGAMISGGFKAPGPDGLRKSLEKVAGVIENALAGQSKTKLRPIHAYDIVMHMADAVLSGGVRRSATICLFSFDDEEMVKAKTGDWFETNPQRGRSNNSAVIIRDKITREQFATIMKSIQQSGEPGFIFSDNEEYLTNPCAEIGMYAYDDFGNSGFQMCNLCEINGSKMIDRETFYKACRAASILGTLQAGYTNFKYLSESTRRIVEKEALLGVSITGWMNSPDLLFTPEVLEQGAEIVKSTNELVAKLIGINPAARTTCVKPSGNASTVLGTASGIHGEHSKRYIRHVTKNVTEDIVSLFKSTNPNMVEPSVWSTNGTDVMIAFPIETKEGSIYKKDLLGVKQLEYVKLAQTHWVMPGKNKNVKQHDFIEHNVSNTITVDDWAAVEEYVFNNRKYFTGISFMAASGDKAFPQAPFTEILTHNEIVEKYGVASLFASGLIVDGLHAFRNNLWLACYTVLGQGVKLDNDDHDTLLMRDWVRRANKFANEYFNGDVELMFDCLKDCYNLHKWTKIIKNFKPIDFSTDLKRKEYVSVDTLTGAACSGGACETVF